jgi:AraC family transcriptional regulator
MCDAAGHVEFDYRSPELGLALRLRGQAEHQVRFEGGRSERFVVRPNQLLLVPADERLRGQMQIVGPRGIRHARLALKRDWIAEASLGEFDLHRLDLRWSADLRNPLILEAMSALVREAEHPGPMARISAESLALVILSELVRRQAVGVGEGQSPGPVTQRRLRRVLDYIDVCLGEDLSLPQLAAQAGLSSVHFAREFKRLTGLPPHRYVLQRRAERAAALLEEGETSLKTLALEVGFSSQSHLTAAFQRVYGTTPGAYRDRQAPPV